MPGRRLTKTDRQQIAAGLAKNLDYAEIARRLGRPSSTVSREIARNGGPGRYRADLAQLATTHRARRKPQTPTHPTPEYTGPDPAATSAFVTDFTAAIIETGVPRTAAGVMACLFTSETGSRTAAELAQHLQVSAATISHAVALLEEQALIRRARDNGSRRHRYFIDDDAAIRTTVVGVRANQRLATIALRGAALFGTDTTAGARLAITGQFLDQVGNDMIRSAERHWRIAVGKRLE